MNWAIIIVVVAIGVYILASLLQGNDEEPTPRRPARPGTQRPPGQRPGSDIDRFLEEVERRRRQSGERPRQAPPARRQPVERPAPPRPPRYETTAPPPRPVAPPQAPRPVPPPAPVLLATPVAPITRPVIVAPAREPAKLPPAGNQVMALLQSPSSLQAAFLLQEILGPPRCKRLLRPS